MKTLILAMALLGQTNGYDLIDEAAPRATIRTARGAYRDDKVAALADARAKVRAYERALEDARAQVASLAQEVVTDEPAPRSRIEGSDRGWRPAITVRETSPAYYSSEPAYDAPITYQTTPRFYSAAPRTYSAAPAYYTSAPTTYSYGAPVTYGAGYSAGMPVTYGAGYSAGMPMTYGSSFYGASPVTYSMGGGFFGASAGGCVGGACN